MANSFAILGSSLGAALYVLLGEYLSRKLDPQGLLLALAAVQLSCLVTSLLLSEHNVPYSLLEYNRGHNITAITTTSTTGRDFFLEKNNIYHEKLDR